LFLLSTFKALEKIIQRECFPELEKLTAQNAYLDAVANNDIQMMRELTMKYGGGKSTPSLSQGLRSIPLLSTAASSFNKNI